MFNRAPSDLPKIVIASPAERGVATQGRGNLLPALGRHAACRRLAMTAFVPFHRLLCR